MPGTPGSQCTGTGRWRKQVCRVSGDREAKKRGRGERCAVQDSAGCGHVCVLKLLGCLWRRAGRRVSHQPGGQGVTRVGQQCWPRCREVKALQALGDPVCRCSCWMGCRVMGTWVDEGPLLEATRGRGETLATEPPSAWPHSASASAVHKCCVACHPWEPNFCAHT